MLEYVHEHYSRDKLNSEAVTTQAANRPKQIWKRLLKRGGHFVQYSTTLASRTLRTLVPILSSCADHPASLSAMQRLIPHLAQIRRPLNAQFLRNGRPFLAGEMVQLQNGLSPQHGPGSTPDRRFHCGLAAGRGTPSVLNLGSRSCPPPTSVLNGKARR